MNALHTVATFVLQHAACLAVACFVLVVLGAIAAALIRERCDAYLPHDEAGDTHAHPAWADAGHVPRPGHWPAPPPAETRNRVRAGRAPMPYSYDARARGPN
jgi:hypothetical protein